MSVLALFCCCELFGSLKDVKSHLLLCLREKTRYLGFFLLLPPLVKDRRRETTRIRVGTGATGNSRTQIVQWPSAHVQALSSGHWHHQAACARSDTAPAGRLTRSSRTLSAAPAPLPFGFRDELSRESRPSPAPEAEPRSGVVSSSRKQKAAQTRANVSPVSDCS